jgi:hypothetical protein
MTEIEFHLHRFEMLSNIKIGFEDMLELIELYCKSDLNANKKIMNTLLFKYGQIKEDLSFYEVLYTESLIFLEKNSINPTFLSPTLQQCIDLDLTSLGRYSIIPVQIYVSVINFFKSIFKTGN